MNKPFSLLASLGVIFAAGCCSIHPNNVAVIPEAIFRTEISITNRIHLPLNASGRKQLEGFLAAGGRPNNVGGAQDLQAVPQAKALLDLLAQRTLQKTDTEELTNPVLRGYFGKSFIRQVIDARNPDPRHVIVDGEAVFTSFPFAGRHDRFWWIFYPDDSGNLTGLMVVRDIYREKPNE